MDIDILIKNGMICDGRGNPPFIGDIGIKDEKILFISGKEDDRKGEGIRCKPHGVIDAEGKAVSPGFINIHSHSDIYFFVDPGVPSVLRQGITTEVMGNCGMSPAPVMGEIRDEYIYSVKKELGIEVPWRDYKEYFDLVEKRKPAVNIVALVGGGNLRGSVVGLKDRPATPEEMNRMRELVREMLEQGAWGFSTGLIYPPSSYADTHELVEMARVTGEMGGYYASHIRGEASTLFTAIEEALEIGKKSGCRVEISHLKAAARCNWGKVGYALDLIHNARNQGLWVQQDQYPYTASATGLDMVVPDWAKDGGNIEFLRRLKQEDTRKRILAEMEDHLYINGDEIIISSVVLEKNKKYEGKKIHALARELNQTPQEFILDLLIEEENLVGAIYLSMREEDVEQVMRDPWTSIGNDAGASATEGPLNRGKLHPRTYGTFPRVIGKYSRQKGLFPLEEAIRRMTSLPAQMIGLKDRGRIEEGFYADLVVFDPNTIEDTSTFEKPSSYPAGLDWVIVNGGIALARGEQNSVGKGKVLKSGFRRNL